MNAPLTYTIRKDDPRLTLRGVRRHGKGWQVYRMVGGAPQRRSMPIESTLGELVDAWEALAANVVVAVSGSLAAIVAEYLTRISASPSHGEKTKYLGRWIAELGANRNPLSVTGTEIDQVIQRMKITPTVRVGNRGRATAPGKGLADATIRKRLAALQTCYTVMFPAIKNAVQQCTQRPRAPKPQARGIPMADVVRILAAMPDGRGASKQLSLAKIRATVTAYTGLDPAQIMALTPGDLMLKGDAPWFRVGRDKGDGVAVGVVQLTEPGRRALQAFVDANAFGRYASNGVNVAVKTAAAKVGIALGTFRQKDLRHSFLTEMYRITGDQATVARFALHCEGSSNTARYTKAAHEAVDRVAAARFVLPATPAPTPAKVVDIRRHERAG